MNTLEIVEMMDHIFRIIDKPAVATTTESNTLSPQLPGESTTILREREQRIQVRQAPKRSQSRQ